MTTKCTGIGTVLCASGLHSWEVVGFIKIRSEGEFHHIPYLSSECHEPAFKSLNKVRQGDRICRRCGKIEKNRGGYIW